jgi:hypothetical protein
MTRSFLAQPEGAPKRQKYPHAREPESCLLDLRIAGHAGMTQAEKARRYPEIMDRRYFNPRELYPTGKPPTEIEAAFRTVFTDAPELFLWFHPFYSRWCIFQVCPDIGPLDCEIIAVCMEATREGHLPADLDFADGRHESMRSVIGDFRRPDTKWFVTIRAVSDQRWLDLKERTKLAIKAVEDDRQDTEMHWEAWEHDMNDHTWFAVWRRFNHGRRGYCLTTSRAECRQISEDRAGSRARIAIKLDRGLTVRVHPHGKLAESYTAEVERAAAATDSSLESKAQELRRKREARAHLESAKALLSGTPRRTL